MWLAVAEQVPFRQQKPDDRQHQAEADRPSHKNSA